MKNDKVKSKKRKYDTFSITMELEKPLLYNEEEKEISKAKKNKRYLNFIITFSNSFFHLAE